MTFDEIQPGWVPLREAPEAFALEAMRARLSSYAEMNPQRRAEVATIALNEHGFKHDGKTMPAYHLAFLETDARSLGFRPWCSAVSAAQAGLWGIDSLVRRGSLEAWGQRGHVAAPFERIGPHTWEAARQSDDVFWGETAGPTYPPIDPERSGLSLDFGSGVVRVPGEGAPTFHSVHIAEPGDTAAAPSTPMADLTGAPPPPEVLSGSLPRIRKVWWELFGHLGEDTPNQGDQVEAVHQEVHRRFGGTAGDTSVRKAVHDLPGWRKRKSRAR